jgi:hypothetical protein
MIQINKLKYYFKPMEFYIIFDEKIAFEINIYKKNLIKYYIWPENPLNRNTVAKFIGRKNLKQKSLTFDES